MQSQQQINRSSGSEREDGRIGKKKELMKLETARSTHKLFAIEIGV